MNGTINAAGGTGAGGVITATGAGNVNVGKQAIINADGITGGLVSIDGAADTTMSGTISAVGNNGVGGTANVTGQNVVIAVQASMDVSGLTGGGQINVGGGFQGNDENLRNSDSTVVGGLATLKADATNTGDAGQVVIWSDGDTIFGGEISARAMGQVGRGGFVEVSGKRNLRVAGDISASSLSGDRGTVLFDPGSIVVGDGSSDLSIATVNGLLDANTDVIISTQGGDITIDNWTTSDTRHGAIQWNTDASIGIFAAGDVRFLTSVRTAGAGSVNVIAGWGGSESDPILGGGGPAPLPFGGNPEDAWNYYVSGAGNSGSLEGFGVGGNIYINDAGNNRAVEVGSRYGNTNVAGDDVFLTGGSSSYQHAQIGFRDSGMVFYMNGDFRIGDGTQDGTYDAAANGSLVALVGVNEVDGGTLGLGIASGVWGVQMTDSTGVRTDTFIAYADSYNDARVGNWWWRTLDGTAGGSASGIGNNLPEMGAGVSQDLADKGGAFGNVIAKANINVEARGAVLARSGGSLSYTQIGHGGFATHQGSTTTSNNINNTGVGDYNHGRGIDVASRNGTEGDPLVDGSGSDSFYSFNWGSATSQWGRRSAEGIARLAKVYGDVKVRTGLTKNATTGDMEATSASGVVLLQAGQTSSSQNYSQIGHLGVGQAGSVDGLVTVDAGGEISINSGRRISAYAAIGHQVNSDDTADDWRMGMGLLDDGDGVMGAGDKGWTPDGKLGGGLHKQFRYHGTRARRDAEYINTLSFNITDQGLGSDPTGMYSGAQVITGGGAGVMTNLHGDISATSATGGVTLQVYAEAAGSREVWSQRTNAQIGHGGYAEGVNRTNAMGNIIVEANGNGADIRMVSGNGLRDYAQIGHGGDRFSGSDYSSQYLRGDITLVADGDLLLEGGGRVISENNTSMNGTTRSNYALVGHGGFQTGRCSKLVISM